MADIDVIIKKSSTGQGQDPSQSPTAPEAEREPGKQSYRDQAVNAAIITAGKSFATNAVNQYVNLTGNYVFGDRVGSGLELIADTLLVASGPVGQIMTATKYINHLANSRINQINEDEKIGFLRERAGYNSSKNSR